MKKKPPDDEDISSTNLFKNFINRKFLSKFAVPNDNSKSYWLSANDDTKIQIWPYKRSTWRTFLCGIFTFLTIGFLRLIFYWKPEWHIRSTCVSCRLKEADCVLIRDENYQYFLRYVRQAKKKLSTDAGGFTIMDDGGVPHTVESFRYFTHQKVLFIWNPRLQAYRRVMSFDENVPVAVYHRCQSLTEEESARRRGVYGSNEITVKLKPLLYLLFFEVLSPFYAFQAFSIMMWCLDYYYFYSAIIALVSIVTITIDVYQIRKNQRALKNAIVSSDVVTLVRNNQPSEILPSTCLVPGDIIHIAPHGCLMQCDAVLLTGTCIVNESMLTGESVPVTKTHMPYTRDDKETYENKKHSKHTLYNGTRVLQTRYYANQPVKAVVIRTGFNTMKGQLVRSIMYPKPVDFEFTKDLLRFVMLLAVIAVAGFIYSVGIMAAHDIDVGRIIIDSLNVICTVVPAALPAAMSIGIIVAKGRIEKQEVYCISPSTINTCGAVNAVCFDKTGTLTEEGLDLMGVLPAEKQLLSSHVEKPVDLGRNNEVVRAMACCHSLARINGELVGDPLDLILFKETDWLLEEPNMVDESNRFDLLAPTVVRPSQTSSVEIGILRQFTFSSHLQRMSVIVRVLGSSNFVLYCKGAPETIAALCTPDTVPFDFNESLYEYTKKGYRVLALATRVLDLTFVKAQRASREELEMDMEFLGLVVLENRLKPETTPVIKQLRDAAVRSVMVTGDNILTAVSVARECGILNDRQPLYVVEATTYDGPTIKVRLEDGSAPNKLSLPNEKTPLVEFALSDGVLPDLSITPCEYQLAIAGPSFAVITKYFPHLLSQLVSVCNVFARMGPEQKGQFVNCMQELGYVVSMCGDGANDCGALKAAHVGISLSEAEASIASPFTSKRSNISCVPTLIREGRAALVTSFGVFKYMAAYSLNIFMTGCLLQWIGSDMADLQYLFIDLFLISAVAIFFGYTPASDVLSPHRPPTKILSLPSVSSIFVQLFIFTAFQAFAFCFITVQPWFVAFVNPQDEFNPDSYQSTVVFFTSVFQYNIMAIIYSKSEPHRKTLFYNRYLFIWLFFSTSVSVWLAVYPPNFVISWLQLKMPDMIKYRVFIVLLGALNFALCCITEWYFIDWFLTKFVDENGHCKGSSRPKFVTVSEEVGHDVSWLYSATSAPQTVLDGLDDVEEVEQPKDPPSPSPSDLSNNNASMVTDKNEDVAMDGVLLQPDR